MGKHEVWSTKLRSSRFRLGAWDESGLGANPCKPAQYAKTAAVCDEKVNKGFGSNPLDLPSLVKCGPCVYVAVRMPLTSRSQCRESVPYRAGGVHSAQSLDEGHVVCRPPCFCQPGAPYVTSHYIVFACRPATSRRRSALHYEGDSSRKTTRSATTTHRNITYHLQIRPLPVGPSPRRQY